MSLNVAQFRSSSFQVNYDDMYTNLTNIEV